MTLKDFDPHEELFRNIHPLDYDNGRINSSAFNPSEAHNFMLSVDRGSLCRAEDCFRRHLENKLESVGVFFVLKKDFSEESIPTVSDPIEGNVAHALADYNSHGVSQRKKKARRLAGKAVTYGAKFLSDTFARV